MRQQVDLAGANLPYLAADSTFLRHGTFFAYEFEKQYPCFSYPIERLMTHYQTLETEKYWIEQQEKELNKERRSRNRQAIEAFLCFLIGAAAIFACQAIHSHWFG